MKKLIKFMLVIFFVIAALMMFTRNGSKIYKAIFKEREAIKEKPTGMPLEFEAAVLPVKAFKAKRAHFKDTLPVLGTIKGFREVDLKFGVDGVLESFNFEEGERAEEGDIIANLDQTDALLKLEYAKIELDKNKKLFELGAIAKTKLEQSRLEYESAKSDFEKTNLYAPRDGLIGRKHAEEGGYVRSRDDKIVTFVDIGSVYAEFGIIEKDIPKVALGQKTQVFVDAYPDKSYEGAVDQISPVVEGKSRTQTLRVKLDNPKDMLKPGMFSRGIIATYEKENALIVPTTAAKKKEGGFFVYVIHRLGAGAEAGGEETEGAAPEVAEGAAPEVAEGAAPEVAEGAAQEVAEGAAQEAVEGVAQEAAQGGEFGQVEIRDIEVKYMAPDYTEVSKGLKEGELVAIELREELKDKAKVEIKEVQESPF